MVALLFRPSGRILLFLGDLSSEEIIFRQAIRRPMLLNQPELIEDSAPPPGQCGCRTRDASVPTKGLPVRRTRASRHIVRSPQCGAMCWCYAPTQAWRLRVLRARQLEKGPFPRLHPSQTSGIQRRQEPGRSGSKPVDGRSRTTRSQILVSTDRFRPRPRPTSYITLTDPATRRSTTS